MARPRSEPAPPPPPRGPRLPTPVLPALLALAGLLLAGSSAWRKSVTIDEFANLPHGLAILKTGAFHMDVAATPLARILGALPLLAAGARLDVSEAAATDSSWAWGRRFAAAEPERYHGLFLAGRAVSLLFLLLAGLLAWGYARSLYGAAGGLAAAACLFLEPNLLAHGRLVTADIHLAAALVAALWAGDRLLRAPGWRPALLLGLALGAAVLFKSTALLLFGLLPLAAGLIALGRRLGPGAAPEYPISRKTWLWLAAGLAAGVAAINLGYLGDGSLAPLGRYDFATDRFRGLQRLLPGWLPVPLPWHFLRGLDAQLAEGGYPAYLCGVLNREGFPHYYLVAFLVKTPTALLLLALLALVHRPRLAAREIPPLVVGAGFFLFLSLAGHKNIGLRYLLLIYPLLGIWAGRLALPGLLAPRLRRAALALGAAGMLGAALLAWPHYLPFFNQPAGGPARGHEYLLDSNLDWGQDLPALEEWMAERRVDQVDLVYCGRIPPELYGIRYRHGFQGAQGRYFVISANFLWGRPYFANGTGWWLDEAALGTYAPLRLARPEAILGHTLYVFDTARR